MEVVKQSDWAAIVSAVKTPIGLAALSLLVMSAIFTALTIRSEVNISLLAFGAFSMICMIAILFFVFRSERQATSLESLHEVKKLDENIYSALEGFLEKDNHTAWANLLYCICRPVEGDIDPKSHAFRKNLANGICEAILRSTSSVAERKKVLECINRELEYADEEITFLLN